MQELIPTGILHMESLYLTTKWLFAIGGTGFLVWLSRVLYVKVQASISREEAAGLIADKVRPLEESQKRTEEMVSKLLDIQLNKKN